MSTGPIAEDTWWPGSSSGGGKFNYGIQLLGNVPVRMACGAKNRRRIGLPAVVPGAGHGTYHGTTSDLGQDTGNTQECASDQDPFLYVHDTSPFEAPSMIPYGCGMDFGK